MALTWAEIRALCQLVPRHPLEALAFAHLKTRPGVRLHGGAWLARPAAVAATDEGRIEIEDGLFAPGRIELQARDRGLVHIGPGCSIEVGARLAAACDATLRLGHHVGVGPYSILNAFGGNLTIGDWSMLGPHVSVHTVDHGIRLEPTPMRLQEGVSADVTVGDDVWVGAGVVLLKGVTIGSGAVVAAGAVVTHDVWPNTIVGGVPARKIGERHP